VLQIYASHPEQSRGRRRPEEPAPTRNDFQRDRDRIVHSTAFRRLVYKTQVFLNHEGDLFRTRLTHSIELAQIARSIARELQLNEDLVEAVALAHDLGHTPFGHAGQDALDECARRADPVNGGFEHNLQSLRVVDELEERYPAFDGLNLCFETREGILKHCSRANAQRLCAAEPGGPAQRFLDRTVPSLEAQLCHIADEVAYNAHDIDDGVRSGLLSLEQLDDVALFAEHARSARAEFPDLSGRRLMFESVRRMLSAQIYDVMDSTKAMLAQHRPHSADDARRMPVIVGFSEKIVAQGVELKRFLRENLYLHPQVTDKTERAKTVVRDLFDIYLAQPAEMPEAYAAQANRVRSVTDYVAGMTDRFALREHHRLTGRSLF